jgi:hypothetical protein
MASIYAVVGWVRHFPGESQLGVIRGAAGKMFYFTTIAIAFAFVLILTIGTYP